MDREGDREDESGDQTRDEDFHERLLSNVSLSYRDPFKARRYPVEISGRGASEGAEEILHRIEHFHLREVIANEGLVLRFVPEEERALLGLIILGDRRLDGF